MRNIESVIRKNTHRGPQSAMSPAEQR